MLQEPVALQNQFVLGVQTVLGVLLLDCGKIPRPLIGFGGWLRARWGRRRRFRNWLRFLGLQLPDEVAHSLSVGVIARCRARTLNPPIHSQHAGDSGLLHVPDNPIPLAFDDGDVLLVFEEPLLLWVR